MKLPKNKSKDTAVLAAIGGLEKALEIFKDVAGDLGVPGLQAGISGLSTVLAMIQKYHANAEAVKDLAMRVGDLATMVRESAELRGANISSAMQARVDRLLSSWRAINDEAQKLKSRNKVVRLLKSDEDAESITGFVQRLSWSIQSFMVESTLAIEFALDDHTRFAKERFQHVEEELRAIREDVERLQLLPRPEGHTVPLYAVTARYDCRPDRRACLGATRTEVLDSIFTWALGKTPSDGAARSGPGLKRLNIYWLNGLAGTGKTTVAYSVAERCLAEGVLGASFFCSRSDTDCSNPSMIFTTIAYQLGLFYPPYRDCVAEILQRDPLLVYSSVTRQFEELIVRPLSLLRDHFPPCVVVIDALDECREEHITSAGLSTLLKDAEALYPIRFFVTSRPEEHIITTFDSPSFRDAFGLLRLHEVKLEKVTTDIRRFLMTSLSETRRRFKLEDSWPSKEDVDTLSQSANGLFIFAATAIKFIEDKSYKDPCGQLKLLVSTATPRGSHRLLDHLYLQVLETAFPGSRMSSSLSGRLKSILGSIVVIKDPLPPIDLSRLVQLPSETIYNSLNGLHSVLVVPEPEASAAEVHIIHPTFAEFLFDSTRCTSHSFVINSRHQHTFLLRRCLDAMLGLKRDICNTQDPSLLNIELHDLPDRVTKEIPPYVQYACRHWPTHLLNGDLSDEILDALLEFTEKRLLYWVEACSLLGILRDTISSLNESQGKLMNLGDKRAQKIAVLFNDCERLIVGFFPSISSSALQLYHSVLSFVPKETALAKTYTNEHHARASVKVVHGVPDLWDACLGTMVTHEFGDWVRTVDFSPDGRVVASAGDDKKIQLWDALTCTLLLVLSGHAEWVYSVKYSSDGMRIVSTAADRTIKIWDAVSGVLLRTLEEDQRRVNCAVFTPDGGCIVSGFDDGTVRIWDAQAGTSLATLSGHQDAVMSIVISPDGQWMASQADDGQVYLWKLEAPYTHRHRVLAVKGDAKNSAFAFSLDSSEILVACPSRSTSEGRGSVWDTMRSEGLKSAWGSIRSDDSRRDISIQIFVHDVTSGKCLRTLKPSGWPNTRIRSFAISPAGDELACGLDNKVITADLSNGELRRVLRGHTNEVIGIAYNHDGTRIVSGSYDGSVRLWSVSKHTMSVAPTSSNSSLLSGVPAPLGCVSAVFSRDGSRLLCVWSNGTIVVEATNTWKRLDDPLSSTARMNQFDYAALSPDGSAILAGDEGGFIVELSDATIGSMRINLPDSYHRAEFTDMWRGVLGYTLHCFGGHSSPLMFSQDGRYLVVGSGDNNGACLWNVATGELVRQFTGHSRAILCVAFSLDADRIATGSEDESVIIWDANTGAPLAACYGHNDFVHSVAFSPTGALAASGSTDRVRVWDADTGKLLQSFRGHSTAVDSVAFTPGGDVVISASPIGDGTMRLWDVGTGDCLQVFHTKTWGRTIELTPDGTGIVVGNGRVVQLWSPLDADTQPTMSLPWLPCRTWPDYYIEDGWIFSLSPVGRRRLCWVQADPWEGVKAYFSHTIVLYARRTILDFASLNS